jgi:hypothetical protein
VLWAGVSDARVDRIVDYIKGGAALLVFALIALVWFSGCQAA